MKTLLLAGALLAASSSAHAATKSAFSIFLSGSTLFAEVTCTGIPGAPSPFTFILPATDASGLSFEANANLITPYHLVVDAYAASDQPTLFVTFAREDETPVMASTYGLDLRLRESSASTSPAS